MEGNGRPGHAAARQRAAWGWGTGIIFWSRPPRSRRTNDGEEEEKDIFFLRTYTVFNVDQVEGEHLDHLRVGHTVITPIRSTPTKRPTR